MPDPASEEPAAASEEPALASEEPAQDPEEPEPAQAPAPTTEVVIFYIYIESLEYCPPPFAMRRTLERTPAGGGDSR